VHDAAGGGFPGETVAAIWNLVWRGAITNDTFHALRAFTRPPERRGRKIKPGSGVPGRVFHSRRVAPPSAEGRWSLVSGRMTRTVSPTEASAALAQQLLSRYGVLTREVAAAEGIVGGFSAVYDVLRALEDAGRIRRGYFASGVGATQFALPAALDLLRSLRTAPEEPEVVVLGATDPANPYGTLLKWPAGSTDEADASRGPTRTVGAVVVVVNGALAAYVSRGARQLIAFLPEDEPARSITGRALSAKLAQLARGEDGRLALLIAEINGVPASEHPLAGYLVDAGFSPSAMGFQIRRPVVTRGA
jgi:ATP-dependent Lhr-like helicase